MPDRPTLFPQFADYVALALGGLASSGLIHAAPLGYEGAAGPGKGKNIVLIAGDHEYKSEQALPQLARILAKHHGFRCTVLFGADFKGGFGRQILGATWLGHNGPNHQSSPRLEWLFHPDDSAHDRPVAREGADKLIVSGRVGQGELQGFPLAVVQHFGVGQDLV